MAPDKPRRNATSFATDGSAVPFCVSQTNFSIRNVRIRWSPHLVALEEGLTTGPSHFSLLVSEAHSLTTPRAGLFLPQPLLSPFLGKQIAVMSTVTVLLLGQTNFCLTMLAICNPHPPLRPQASPWSPCLCSVALLRSPADSSASTSALLVQSLLLASTPTPRLQEAPAFSSWVRMKIAGH